MNKLYINPMAALGIRFTGYSRAVYSFLLALTLSSLSYTGMAQVVITPATGGTTICRNSALGGTAPTCTTLGPITITETNNGDFPIAGSQITLAPPAGWQFCISSVPVITTLAGEITVTALSAGTTFTATSLTLNITGTGIVLHDALTITGLRVQALSTVSSNGFINATSVTGVLGIATGTGAGASNFGDLALIPTAITGPALSVCIGRCISLSSTPSGGVWSSSSAAATVSGTSGAATVCGVSTGNPTISYTVGGCTITQLIPVNPNPPSISGLLPTLTNAHMCAWYDSLTVTDVANSSGFFGLYSSSLVTVDNLPGGAGKIKSHAPGTASVTYTWSTGCSTTATITIDPLPAQIQTAPFRVCEHSFYNLTDATPGGVWSNAPTSVGTIDPSTGIYYGVAPGTSLVTYTIPGGFGAGCITDTTMTVMPLPLPILTIDGTAEICSLSTTRLADLSAGGVFHSVTGTVASVTLINPDTVLVTGITAGTELISYTMPNGCATTVIVTIDPLPSPITGPHAVCVNDSILLSSITLGGTWSTSNPTKVHVDSVTGYVTGLDSGVAVIKYSINPGNCSVSYTVTVNPLPLPITGPDSVCNHQSFIQLRDSTAGGSWSSTIVPIITYVDTTGILTGYGPGVDTIYYTLSTGCRVRYIVTVNDLPPAIIGRDSLCIGDSTLYTDISTTGGTWSLSSAGIVGISATFLDSVRVGAISSGIVTLSYTNPSGCYTTKTIVVNQIPTPILSDTAICQYHSTMLTVASPTGGHWTSDNTAIASIDFTTGVLTGHTTGSTIITYTGPGGCFTILPFTVHDYDSITGPHRVCEGDSVFLYNLVATGYWFPSDSTIVNVRGGGSVHDTAIVKGLRAGVVTIYYQMPFGCLASYTFTVDPVPHLSVTASAICVGDSLTISSTVPGGTWGSNNLGIATTSVLSLTPSAARVHGVGAGVCIITYDMPSGCNAAIQITVNPLPGPIYGPDSVCMYATSTYTDSNLSLTGTWSVAPTSRATINPINGLLTGVDSGWVTVTFTLSTGCSVSRQVYIKLIRAIFGTDNVCVNSLLVLSNTTPGPLGTWSIRHNTIDRIISVSPLVTGSSAVDSGISAGVDTVSYFIAAIGCTVSKIITVNPLPTITGAHQVCEGSSIVDTGHTGGGTWTRSNTHASISFTDSLVTITGTSSGIDTLYYTLPTTCRISYIITVNQTPTGICCDTTICLGRTKLLTDATIGGVWSSSDTNKIVIDTLGNITGVGLGVDTIFYTTPITGCNSQIRVTVEPIPAIGDSQSHPTMICKGDHSILYAYGAGPGGKYTWSPSFGLSATTGATVVASPTLTTTYTVTGTTQWGCDSFNTITVLVDDTLNNIKVVGRDSICRGEYDTLRGSGRAGTYFAWHPAIDLTCTHCDTTIANPTTTTTYVAVAIDDLGCKDSVVFKVTVMPLPIISVTPNPAIICYGTPLQLKARSLNTDSAGTHWAWSPNLFISNDSVYNPIINDTTNLVYRVTATTDFGCHDSFKVKVSVLDTNVNSIVNDTNICIHDRAQLMAFSHSVTSNLNVPAFTWFPADSLSNPFIWNPIAHPLVTTTYHVAIHENVCFSDTLDVTVFVQPYPQIDISTNSPSQLVVSGTPVQFMATVTNTPVLYYAWTPTNYLSCDSCMNPVAIPHSNTTFTVTVSSIYHCISQDTVTLNVNCDQNQVFIPNTFTPNGDGVNDRFFVSGKGISLITLFQVYNRWGELVYEVHNVPPNNSGYGWDGTFKGLVLAPDVFVYIVKAKCELGGDDFNYKGDISLVR